MRIYIPEFSHSPYSLIILLSVLIGILSASLLMKRNGSNKRTIFYTFLLVLVTTIVMAISIEFKADTKQLQVSFSGLGGVLGLVIGVVASGFILKDHPVESICAYLVSANLMYSLSKFACLFTGCCHGRLYDGPWALIYNHDISTSYFPNQIVDILAFMFLYIILLCLYFKIEDKMKLIIISFSIMVPVRFLVEYLRQSNENKIISLGQIKTLLVGLTSIILVIVLRRILSRGKQRSNL